MMRSLVFLLTLLSTVALSQSHLVKDINNQPQGFRANDAIVCSGDYAFFTRAIPVAYSSTSELWVTDGSKSGTKMVATDVPSTATALIKGPTEGSVLYTTVTYPEPQKTLLTLFVHNAATSTSTPIYEFDDSVISQPIKFIASGTITVFVRTFFSTATSEYVTELWRTDGTTDGTVMFRTTPGYFLATIYGAVKAGDFAYFLSMNTSNPKWELWVTDGSDEGTLVVSEIESVPGRQITSMAAFNDELYFIISNFLQNSSESELWKSDGTVTGTTKVMDLPLAAGNLLVLNDKLTFVADGLYVSDGTEAGTQMVLPYVIGSAAIMNDTYYGLRIDLNSPAPNTFELIESDGTSVNTNIIASLNGDSFSQLTPFNGKLIFSGSELMISDLTPQGTGLLKDIYPGEGSSSPSRIQRFGNKIIFTADDGVHGPELWVSDGTADGTELLIDAYTGTQGVANDIMGLSIHTSHGKAVFNAGEKSWPPDIDMWITDGTEASTKKVFDTGNEDYVYPYIGKLNDELYYGLEKKIIKISGLTEQSTIVKDYTGPDFYSHTPWSFNATINGKMIYTDWVTVPSGGVGRELYASDGTADGTKLVKDIRPGIDGSFEALISVVFDDKLIFNATGTQGHEPWVTDGTPQGTFQLGDIYPGTEGSYPKKYVVMGTKVFFIAYDGTSPKLFSTDGTTGNTQLAADILPAGYDFEDMVATSNALYIMLSHETDGWKILKSDGTVVGTSVLKEWNIGTTQTRPGRLEKLGDNIFFVSWQEYVGSDLWMSDGTVANTKVIKHADYSRTTSGISFLWAIQGILYFRIDNELWKTTGSPELMEKVCDLYATYALVYDDATDQVYYYDQTKEDGLELYAFDITGFTQQLALEAINTKTFGDASFDILATSNSGIEITLTSSDHVSISGNTVSIIKPGKATITAQQAGTDVYESAEVKQEFCINPSKPAITTSTNENGVPQLHSAFDDGNRWLLDGIGVSTEKDFTVEKAGNYTLIVSVEGCESVASDVKLITKLSQSVEFIQPAVSIDDGQITLAATASSGLPVTFITDATAITIDDDVVTLLQPGSVTVTAIQEGSDLYLRAATSITFCINPSKPALSVVPAGNTVHLKSSWSADNRWFIGNVEMMGVDTSTIEPGNAGEYSVAAVIDGCSSDRSDGVVLIVTGLEQTATVSVFPNPVSDELTIEWNNSIDVVKASIMNSVGREMVSKDFRKHTTLDVKQFSSGIYFVRVTSGDQSVVKKFVKN